MFGCQHNLLSKDDSPVAVANSHTAGESGLDPLQKNTFIHRFCKLVLKEVPNKANISASSSEKPEKKHASLGFSSPGHCAYCIHCGNCGKSKHTRHLALFIA